MFLKLMFPFFFTCNLKYYTRR